MASNSDLVSMMKVILNMLHDTRKDSSATNEQRDGMESTSSDNKSLERKEQLSQSTLEMAFLGLSSSVKEMKDFLSNKISRLEERVITLEDVVERRLTAIESESCSSLEVVSDRLSSLEESMSTAEETKAIANRLSCLENNMSTLEEGKSIVEKLEEKLTSLAEMKGIEKQSTVKEEGFISKEAIVPQCFDSTCKGMKIVLSNDSKTAERIDGQNGNGYYGGVISKYPLKEEEVFRFIIVDTTDEHEIFSNIAFGVISDKKAEVEEKSSVCHEIKGTWAIVSNIFPTTGKSSVYKDNTSIKGRAYPLDTSDLRVGAVLGIKLCSNGDLHFYFNGMDKGVAFRNVPNNVFAFVDVIGYVTKIQILQ